MAVKEENQIYSANVNSISFMVLSFVFFMMGATFILLSKLIPCIGPGGLENAPDQSVVATVIGMLVGVIALIALTIAAYFNGEKETHGILLGFVVTLFIGLIIIASFLTFFGGRIFFFETFFENLEKNAALSVVWAGDFSLPSYIAALFLLVGGILLFFKKGNYKIVGTTYVLGALMFVFFARALQVMWNAIADYILTPGSSSALAGMLDAQTPLVIAGIFAIVAGVLALYIGISKTNIVKAPLA